MSAAGACRWCSWAVAGPWVVLSPAALAWLARLRAELGPGDVAVTVTSGRRSPAAQAAAMATKLQRGEDLRRLYRNRQAVDEVLAAAGAWQAPDLAAMTRALEAQVARGIYLSPHLRADALDLRTRDQSPAQLAQLRAAVRRTGAEDVLESDHLHCQGLAA